MQYRLKEFAIILNATVLVFVLATVAGIFQDTIAMRFTIIWIYAVIAAISAVLVIIQGI